MICSCSRKCLNAESYRPENLCAHQDRSIFTKWKSRLGPLCSQLRKMLLSWSLFHQYFPLSNYHHFKSFQHHFKWIIYWLLGCILGIMILIHCVYILFTLIFFSVWLFQSVLISIIFLLNTVLLGQNFL
jgi:hypothetical protein